MANFTERDRRKRTLFINELSRRTKIKNILKQRDLDMSTRYKVQMTLNKLNKNSQRERIVNRCVLTERVHSVLKSFKISRIELRNLAGEGYLNGLKKSSW